MDKAQILYRRLMDDFGFRMATGEITARLKDYSILVEQNNVVGNIIEEWLAKWMVKSDIPNVHNLKQASPDFWLDPDNTESDWLEIKSFMGSPNFDVSAFRSFIELIIDKPYKLQASYLLIKYSMADGVITIENCWLKKIWEICSTSSNWPIKVQYRNKTIVNIRPAVWYSDKAGFRPFECLEDFLSALEETIYRYHDTRHLADGWENRLIKSYGNFYGTTLNIPRWMDIKDKYVGASN